MCVLIHAESRKITEEEFRNCFENNKDGFGMAWRSKGKVCFKKGIMTVDDAWEFYSKHKFPLGHILHFRKKSTGELNARMTHPFIVSKDSPIKLQGTTIKPILFHNGTLRSWKDYLTMYLIGSGNNIEDELSDTRLMAIIAARNGRDIFQHFDGRFIVFQTNKTYIYGDFLKRDGVWFSNNSYEEKKTTVYGSTTKTSGVTKPTTSSTSESNLSWHDIANYKVG